MFSIIPNVRPKLFFHLSIYECHGSSTLPSVQAVDRPVVITDVRERKKKVITDVHPAIIH